MKGVEGRYGGGKLIRVEDRGAVIKGIPNFVITLFMFLRKLVSGVASENVQPVYSIRRRL